jgi:hypothetical protein
MTEVNRIPSEVCNDRHEIIGINCWQKQDCGFTREQAEITSISNIRTQEKVVSISAVNATFIAASRDSL